MLNEDELEIGKHYFLVLYFDYGLTVPGMETYIYVGKNIFSNLASKDSWYFQDPGSYFEKGIFSDIDNKEDFELLNADEDTLQTMFNLDALLEELKFLRNS